MLFTVSIDGYVCEMQLHVAVIFNAKKGGAGHTMYKLCRLVLQAPIVSVGTYTGEYDNGRRRHGQGRMVYACGDVYEGEWKAGVREGHGTFLYATGHMYEGEWKADVFEGHGTYRYASGDVYEGEFKADVQEGHGTFQSADGNVYEGEWKAGVQEGHGTYRYADVRVEVGWYEGGADVGEGVRWSTDRHIAERVEEAVPACVRRVAEAKGEGGGLRICGSATRSLRLRPLHVP